MFQSNSQSHRFLSDELSVTVAGPWSLGSTPLLANGEPAHPLCEESLHGDAIGRRLGDN
jgi:hypothetical protein